MLYKNRNYVFGPFPNVSDGDEFFRCNLESVDLNTEVFSGTRNLVFRGCRIVNCFLPIDATLDDCNAAQIDFCTNIHPERIDHGQIACEENCRHVVNTDSVTIDGELAVTVYYYEDTRQ